MSSNFLRSSVLVLIAGLFSVNASRAVTFHYGSTATLSQPSNDGNGPGGGAPNPDCPDCVVRAL